MQSIFRSGARGKTDECQMIVEAVPTGEVEMNEEVTGKEELPGLSENAAPATNDVPSRSFNQPQKTAYIHHPLSPLARDAEFAQQKYFLRQD
jgi:hypothetical protein